MLFRIAALWGCPVRHVESALSASELMEWIAYYGIEPFGDHWRTFTGAYAAAGIASCTGGKNQKVKDFMPDLNPHRQTAEEMMAIFEGGIANSEHKVING